MAETTAAECTGVLAGSRVLALQISIANQELGGCKHWLVLFLQKNPSDWRAMPNP